MASVISRFSISDELKVMFILEKDAQTKASKKFGFTMKITFWKKYKKNMCSCQVSVLYTTVKQQSMGETSFNFISIYIKFCN